MAKGTLSDWARVRARRSSTPGGAEEEDVGFAIVKLRSLERERMRL